MTGGQIALEPPWDLLACTQLLLMWPLAGAAIMDTAVTLCYAPPQEGVSDQTPLLPSLSSLLCLCARWGLPWLPLE